VYWKIPYRLRFFLWGGAAWFGMSVALRYLGLGDPPVWSMAELARVLVFAAVLGLVVSVSEYAERRHRLSKQERHKYDLPDAE
jgi:hypothetical protein